jgi:hypothetical protein
MRAKRLTNCGKGSSNWQMSTRRGVGVVAVGCINNKDGQKLADSGLAVANSLANYYDTLDQQVDDLVEVEAFSDVLRGLTSSDSQSYQQEMQQTKEALQRRARLARQLASTYQSLKDLSSYDASGEVSSSFDKLGEALAGIPPLKSLSASASATAPVDPSQLVSKGAGLVASWKQSRDIEKAVNGVTETLDGLTKLFGHELPACQVDHGRARGEDQRARERAHKKEPSERMAAS